MLYLTGLPERIADIMEVFPDHSDPRLKYYLPPSLALSVTPDGDPDFLLLRYHGDFSETTGGLLRFRLHFCPPPEAARLAAEGHGLALRVAPIDEARFRLRLRSWQTGQEDQSGAWHPALFAGPELVAPLVSLDAFETEFLKDLLESGLGAVELELELRYQALRPGLPWLAMARTQLLREYLAAALPAPEAGEDEVVSAFLSIPQMKEGPVSWRSLEPDVAELSPDRLLTETAQRALDGRTPMPLFERLPAGDPFEPARYRLLPAAPAEPAEILWDLRPPCQEGRTLALAWSVSELGEYLEDADKRRKIFPIAGRVSPFAQVVVHVINRVPYDPAYLKRVAVDLRYPGDSGLLEFRGYTFNGQTEIEHFSTFYQALGDDFRLEYRLTSTVAAPDGQGWPAVREGEWLPAGGTVVEVNRSALGMDFVRVEAEPQVFEKASVIEVEILPSPAETAAETNGQTPPLPLGRLALTGEQPAHWVALPGVDAAKELHTRVLAQPPSGQDLPRVVLREGPIQSRRVFIAAYQLEVLDPAPITVRLDPQFAARCARVAVWLAPLDGEGRAFNLDTEQPIVWNFFRSSIFAPLRYRYRVEWVGIDGDGQLLAMQITDWIISESADLAVYPPEQAPEVQQ